MLPPKSISAAWRFAVSALVDAKAMTIAMYAEATCYAAVTNDRYILRTGTSALLPRHRKDLPDMPIQVLLIVR
jgi:hypothetical protein